MGHSGSDNDFVVAVVSLVLYSDERNCAGDVPDHMDFSSVVDGDYEGRLGVCPVVAQNHSR